MIRSLVVHTGAIGDLILCGPSMAALRREGPVELAGQPERLQIAVLAGWADAAHNLGSTGFESIFATPGKRWKQFASRFDRIVVWMRDDDCAIARGCGETGVSRVHIHPGLPPQDWTRHASEYYLSKLEIVHSVDAFIELDRHPSGEVLIHPGSGSPKKNWPMERFEELAAGIDAMGHSVAFIAGPAETDLRYPPLAKVIRESNLEALAQRLADARVYVGNDSGITHLAAAVRCPTVALFGPTNPTVWAPRGSHVRVVAKQPWPDVADVYPAVGLT
ncbi:MAG: hypothetical protein AMXMBFR84_02700 [Candidatus Hydrogenedentota bacterium]